MARPTTDRNRRDGQITFRIQEWLLDEIKAEAERDRRTVADVIVMTLETRFVKKGKK
jgi:hypothetical protein